MKGKETERDEHTNRTEKLREYIEKGHSQLRKYEEDRKQAFINFIS